ncbi:MAG: nitroreductase [Hyphomicrobiales bacterium]|nr:MAG: nitroreductase [Hyphomicrobiales bacterium]
MTIPFQDTYTADTLEALLTNRFSCRAFRADPVPRDDIERLLRIAQRTASWCNTQPWQVIVTSDRATDAFRDALYSHAQVHPMQSDFPEPKQYVGPYQDRRRDAGYALYNSLGIERQDYEARNRQLLENFRFFDAPHAAVITTDRDLSTYGAVDAGGYVATLLLAAQSLGIAAIPQAAIAMHSSLVRRHFELPEDRMVLCGVSFGYPDLDHPANSFRTTRAPLEEVVQWHEK